MCLLSVLRGKLIAPPIKESAATEVVKAITLEKEYLALSVCRSNLENKNPKRWTVME